jgi:hypothetical protein
MLEQPVPPPARVVTRAAPVWTPTSGARVWVANGHVPGGPPPFSGVAARRLLSTAARRHVDWALLAAAVRTSGRPARPLVRALARRRARRDPWSALLALEGRTAFADRTLALARAYRGAGPSVLTRGLGSGAGRLASAVLADARIVLARNARADVAGGRVDARVLALLRYLAETRGRVVVIRVATGIGPERSLADELAHRHGTAVDVAALRGPAAVVRDTLLLPDELRPRKAVSLPGSAPAAFPLGPQAERVHLSY